MLHHLPSLAAVSALLATSCVVGSVDELAGPLICHHSEWSGRYWTTVETLRGDCGDIPPRETTYDYSPGYAAGPTCVDLAPVRASLDRCSVTMHYRCTGLADTTDVYELRERLSQVDSDTMRSEYERTVYTADMVLICSGVYRATSTRIR